MESLPDEIILRIFLKPEYLSAKDLINLKLTCKKFFNVILKYNAIDQNHPFYEQKLTHQEALIEFFYPEIKKISYGDFKVPKYCMRRIFNKYHSDLDFQFMLDKIPLTESEILYALEKDKNTPKSFRICYDCEIIVYLENDPHKSIKIDKKFISKQKSLKDYIIKKYPDFNWYYNNFLSSNESISLESINSRPDLNWQYRLISIRKDIKPEDFEKYPNIKWDYQFMFDFNQNKPLDEIFEYCMKKGIINKDTEGIRFCKNLTINLMQKYPEINWDFENIAKYSKIMTEEEVLNQNLFSPKYFAQNPRASFGFIQKYRKIEDNIKNYILKRQINKKFFEDYQISSRQNLYPFNENLTWKLIVKHRLNNGDEFKLFCLSRHYYLNFEI